MLRTLLCLFILGLCSRGAFGQTEEYKASSATDSKVRIERGGRNRPTSDEEGVRLRYKAKKKRLVSVGDPKHKVYTTSKRKQRRNNKFRTNTYDSE